jgi:hypothetical protein
VAYALRVSSSVGDGVIKGKLTHLLGSYFADLHLKITALISLTLTKPT